MFTTEEFKNTLPVKGFFMEDALKELCQSKALLGKKYGANGQLKN